MARARPLGASAGAAALAAALGAAPARAQRPSAALTAVAASHPLALAGVGLEGDAGLSARLGLAAAAGVAAGGGGRAAGEFAATGRFLLDPLRQAPRGVYATGGLALRVVRAEQPRALVLAGVGVEGRPRGRVVPALEAGFGGGARVSFVLRPARPGRR